MDSIKSSSDITNLFTTGKRFHLSQMTLIVLPTRDRFVTRSGRVAFIAGKKLGNAVWRNAAKRRMRALCREAQYTWPGFDVVFLAKADILHVPYGDLLRELRAVCQKRNGYFIEQQ